MGLPPLTVLALATHGERPRLRVARPLVVAGDTVVAAGAPVFVTVRSARGAHVPAIPARLVYSIDSTVTIDGRSVPLGIRDTLRGETRWGTLAGVAVLTYGMAAVLVTGGAAMLPRCETLLVPMPTLPSTGGLRGIVAGPASSDAPCRPGEAQERRARVRSEPGATFLGLFAPGAGRRAPLRGREGEGLRAHRVRAGRTGGGDVVLRKGLAERFRDGRRPHVRGRVGLLDDRRAARGAALQRARAARSARRG